VSDIAMFFFPVSISWCSCESSCCCFSVYKIRNVIATNIYLL